jgi:tetratricopeptide (TPR) repeat protein
MYTMDYWGLAVGASLMYSLYNAWPEMVAAPARRALQTSRYADAMRAFARSASFIPSINRNGRARMMLQASMAALDAGLPQQAVNWAERVLGVERAYPVFSILAHSAAARGFSDTGDAWTAERHLTLAIDAITPVAERVAAAKGILAGMLAQSADELRKRGDLRQAIDKATRAIEMGPSAHRDASTVIGECAVTQGRYDDALRWFHNARSGPAYNTPWAEVRAQGLLSLQMAATYASAERPDDVLPHLNHAYQSLGSDPRLRLWCDCTALQLRAFGGDPATVQSEIASMQAAAERFPEDRTTRLRVWSTLARAALRVGEYSTALIYFAREEAEGLDPVWEPRNAYGVGLCRLAMTEVDAARHAFRRAVSRNLDTHHDRLARRALAELDAVDASDVAPPPIMTA